MAATGFGFNIPTGATILGIVVEVEGYGSGSQAARRGLSASPTKDGTTKAGNTGSQTDMTTTTPESGYKTWGTSSDLWGTTWTVTQINASTFGVLLQPAGTTGYSRFVDHVRVTVYYTPPIKAITDTGAGSDSAPNIKAGIALSDSGAGVDVATARNMTAATPISVSDAGSGAEAYRKTMRMSETGAGVDALAGKGLRHSDAGAGVETWRKGMRMSDASASAIDALAVKSPVFLSDTGAGAGQTPSIKAAFTITDTGAGVDALRGKGIKTFDAGTGVDAVAGLRKKLATLADTGAGADAVATAQKAYIVVSDASAAGQDRIAGQGRRLSDAGTGADAAPFVKKQSFLSDSGAGADGPALVKARLSLSEAGQGQDTAQSRRLGPSVSDTAHGVDYAVATESSGYKSISDIGAGIDVAAGRAIAFIHDTMFGLEGLSINLGAWEHGVTPRVRDFEIRGDRGRPAIPSPREKSFDITGRRDLG